MAKKFEKNQGGFTFTEIMAAMTIFLVGLLGLCALQLAGIRNNRLSGCGTQALSLVQMQMEQILQADFHAPHISDVNPSNNQDLMSVENCDYENVDAEGKKVDWSPYQLIWNVADGLPVAGTKTIVVTVLWDNRKSSRQLIGVKSLVF